jgi:hypothetical protein
VSFTGNSFYVQAHEDDWQLFMNLNAYNDLVGQENKVIFITITAGDAGLGSVYWLAREEGFKSSIRFCLAPQGPLSESSGIKTINNCNIYFWSVNNVTCYFMRLPDGNPAGSGFAAYDNQSICQLQTGAINCIRAVDQSATYTSWSNLYSTINAIIEAEMVDTVQVKWINYPDPNTTINPSDHSDHITTGNAVQAMGILSCLNQALFIDYHLNDFPADLSGVDLVWKSGMFAAYEKAVYDGAEHSTIGESPDAYIGWCLRSAQFRTIAITATELVPRKTYVPLSSVRT